MGDLRFDPLHHEIKVSLCLFAMLEIELRVCMAAHACIPSTRGQKQTDPEALQPGILPLSHTPQPLVV